MKAREFLARKTAREVLEELGISSLPVDVMDIVARRSLLFEEHAELLPTVYGAIFRGGDTFGVMVSKDCFGERHRRFTVAHELGHYHLPDHLERLLPPGTDLAVSLAGNFRSGKDPIEVEADLFANELLMPEKLVRPVVKSALAGLPAVRLLADTCDTSLSSAAVRYAALSDDPIAVLLSKDGVIEWASRSSALWEHSWSRSSWKKDWAPSGSATQQLAHNPARVAGGEMATSSCLLCEWIPSAPTNIEVQEDAVGLGSYGRALTVLYVPELPDADDSVDSDSRDGDDPPDWRDAMRPYRLG